MFIQIDRSTHVPVYLQIEDRLRKLILEGTVRPGDRLPSTRQLAGELGVNRITVEAAFTKLEAEGLISSHVGRGTFVNRVMLAPETRTSPAAIDPESISRIWSPMFVDLRLPGVSLPALNTRPTGRTISFVAAAPPSDLFPGAPFRRAVDYVLKRRTAEIAGLGSSDGLRSLKSYLVRWLAQNGIDASEDEIVITTGCQQSMFLIRKILVAPGDALMMENPTYPGAIAALAPSASERLELPAQLNGPDLRVFSSLSGRSRCKLIYVVPNFHNPTGRTMPLEIRRRLVEAVEELRIPIIEDDIFGELRYGGHTEPSLKSLCPHMVIYISSFSKMLSPGVRVGWIVAPRPVAKQLNAVKQTCDLHTSLLMQAALEEFCRRDLLHRHLKRVRRIFVRRRDAMAEALHRYLPSGARWELPEGGLSMWLSLPPEFDTEALLQAAQERGVQFLPGSAFYFRSPMYNSLRLSFASETEERIREGIQALGALLGRRTARARMDMAWSDRAAAPPPIM